MPKEIKVHDIPFGLVPCQCGELRALASVLVEAGLNRDRRGRRTVPGSGAARPLGRSSIRAYKRCGQVRTAAVAAAAAEANQSAFYLSFGPVAQRAILWSAAPPASREVRKSATDRCLVAPMSEVAGRMSSSRRALIWIRKLRSSCCWCVLEWSCQMLVARRGRGRRPITNHTRSGWMQWWC